MGLKLTISNSDYSIPVEVIPDFLFKSDGAISFSYYHSLKSVSFKSTYVASFDYVITQSITGVSSCKMTVPASNTVAVHAICIGTDVSGNAIVLYLDNSGLIRSFPKNGNTASIVTLNTLVAPRPSVAKGIPVTITHGATSFTVSYTGFTKTILYSDIPALVNKGFGFLATGAVQSSYTFEILE